MTTKVNVKEKSIRPIWPAKLRSQGNLDIFVAYPVILITKRTIFLTYNSKLDAAHMASLCSQTCSAARLPLVLAGI